MSMCRCCSVGNQPDQLRLHYVDITHQVMKDNTCVHRKMSINKQF